MGCGTSSYDDDYGGYRTDSNGYRNSRYRSDRNGYPSHHRTERYPNRNEFRTTTVEERRPIETTVRRTDSPAIHETTTIINEGRSARSSPVVGRHEEIRVRDNGSTSTRSRTSQHHPEYVTRHNLIEPVEQTTVTKIEERRLHEPELLPGSTTTSHWDRVRSAVPRREYQTVNVWDDRPIRNTYSHVKVGRERPPVETTHYYDDRNPSSWYRRERTAQRMRLHDVVDKRRRHQEVVTSLHRQGTGYNDPGYRSSGTRRY